MKFHVNYLSRDHSEKCFQPLNFSQKPDFTGLCLKVYILNELDEPIDC